MKKADSIKSTGKKTPHSNMNLDLNISNQPLQHSKYFTATPWGFTAS